MDIEKLQKNTNFLLKPKKWLLPSTSRVASVSVTDKGKEIAYINAYKNNGVFSYKMSIHLDGVKNAIEKMPIESAKEGLQIIQKLFEVHQ